MVYMWGHTMSISSEEITTGITNDYIGAMCSDFRRYKLKCSQERVSRETGYSREMVSKFERGKVSNTIIFLWYIKMGIFNWVPARMWEGWGGYGRV